MARAERGRSSRPARRPAASHVIYEMSPGGVVASAERTAAFRPEIEAAAERHGVDPDTLEAMIFLESAGRPDVIAGPTPESASGPRPDPALDRDRPARDVGRPAAQHRADESGSRTRSRRGRPTARGRAGGGRPALRPEAAIEGAARYLEIAGDRFGDHDLAIASYHMGIGNLESVLRAYATPPTRPRSASSSRDASSPTPQVYFDSGLDSHRGPTSCLRGFGDESSRYQWKVLASEQILSRYRNDPERLAETARPGDQQGDDGGGLSPRERDRGLRRSG